MQTHYEKWYSPALGREMEIKVYGRGGKPVLNIPCQNGRFFDFENFGMADAWAPFLESGQATVFSVDTIDSERGRTLHPWLLPQLRLAVRSGDPGLRLFPRRHACRQPLFPLSRAL